MTDEAKKDRTSDDPNEAPLPTDVCDTCDDSRAFVVRWGYSCIHGSGHSWRRPNSATTVEPTAAGSLWNTPVGPVDPTLLKVDPTVTAEHIREAMKRCPLEGGAFGQHSGAFSGQGCEGCDAAARRDFEKHIGPVPGPTSATACIDCGRPTTYRAEKMSGSYPCCEGGCPSEATNVRTPCPRPECDHGREASAVASCAWCDRPMCGECGCPLPDRPDYPTDLVRDAKRLCSAWLGSDSEELDASVAALMASVDALTTPKRSDP